MGIIEIIKKRRSIRDYSDNPIQKDKLKALVDAARFAPSARGIQPWEFIVVTKDYKLKMIAEISENGRFVAQAKACIAVFCADTKYYLEDGCAATENMLIAAAALGIASCWVAGDKKPYCNQINDLLNVPSSFKLVSLVALGYPKSEKVFVAKEKRSLDELIHWDKF